MGLLDGSANSAPDGARSNSMGDLLGQLGGGDAIKSAGLLAGVMALVQQMGGFESLIRTCQQRGLGNPAQTWLSTGANDALGAAQVSKLFGADALTQLGHQAGMNAQQAGDAVGKLLPELVNQFSPKGSLAGNHEALLKQSLDMFTRSLR